MLWALVRSSTSLGMATDIGSTEGTLSTKPLLFSLPTPRAQWYRILFDILKANASSQLNRQFAVVENPGVWNWTSTLKDEEDNVLAEIDRNWRL